MTHIGFVLSNRSRVSPFFSRVQACGIQSCTVYNHMVLPLAFESAKEGYHHLKTAVQIWDVGAQRQVEIVGPDAAKLVQMSTPRDISRMKDDQCYYIPNVDAQGRLMNDPILIRLAPERYWVSLADSDMLYYYKGLAAGFGLNVSVFEPDVAPLAIQGPKADDVVRRLFGEEYVQTRFFRYKWVDVCGKLMVLARSGWSLQGGFELYVDGREHGEAVWDMVVEAGQDLDIRAGAPNGIERIEGGLLSYGTDVTLDHTPFEAGLGRYCDLDRSTDCLGHAALLKAQTPQRQIRPVEIHGEALPACFSRWPLRDGDGRFAGTVSATAWSYDFETNVAIAMIEAPFLSEGTQLSVEAPDGPREARVRDTFWIR